MFEWTPDCGGKLDYDGSLLKISSRVYPDGAYTTGIYVGDDPIVEVTDYRSGERSRAEAQVIVEKQVEEWRKQIAELLKPLTESTTNAH